MVWLSAKKGGGHDGTLKKLVLVSLITICVIAICFCSALISDTVGKYKRENDYYKDVADRTQQDAEVDFEMLANENSDIVGWIRIPGTRINYPIVQANDNDKYLHTLFNGKRGDAGSLFADCHTDPFKSTLTIIYGHRMKDGSMFASLGKYKKSSFAKKHSNILLFTPEKNYQLEIILFATINALDGVYNTYFTSAESVYDLLQKQAQYTYRRPKPNEKLVMLSTCTYEFENARYVLLCKLQ